ncbi:rRNA N6-adenosine-methyltransferase ZCCHC4 [Sitophilus oryzae]|uniref:rRNA N6-adenosine-methyltransferase ZCCHC4 n=1 Tax=Sitophilus oryzae TaxID=7048 RepID=A0A6J2Y6S4_SITOR|nr:rRNA N6-adenosine-methyltransferase ZCCHC4 [Sitophilus oryzae]
MKQNLFKDDDNNHNIEVLNSDLKSNPKCCHGPTLLFSRRTKDSTRKFYACSACRDRKLCNFFLWADESEQAFKRKSELWNKELLNYVKGIDHRKLFVTLNKIKALQPEKRIFCQTCSIFLLKNVEKHQDHLLLKIISNYQLDHPSEILQPLDNPKKEAQYLFSNKSTECIINIFRNLKYKFVICIGTPRIHEYIQANCEDMDSILLDIDKRYHTFFGPLEFCWYNSFNNYFFFKEGQQVFNDFVRNTNGDNTVLVTDPPFGGRIEPLAETFKSIKQQYRQVNNEGRNLPIFWIFPYFMEPQLQNFLPDLKMLDYKVEYDNHPLFQNGPKGRKQGSPVRIFTNVEAKLIKLPEDSYKYCKFCKKWVSNENSHCKLCNDCTSKNGEPYKHCTQCEKCVKPNWKHCNACSRCTQINHVCQELSFLGSCFQCKQAGHKKSNCPQVEKQHTQKRAGKRKKGSKKKRKIE